MINLAYIIQNNYIFNCLSINYIEYIVFFITKKQHNNS
jgi:hypothetical protein